MANASRPLIGLLLGTVVFFALWTIALKPSGGSAGGQQGLGAYSSAIAAAHHAAAVSAAATAADSGSAAPQAGAPAHPAPTTTAPAHPAGTTTGPSHPAGTTTAPSHPSTTTAAPSRPTATQSPTRSTPTSVAPGAVGPATGPRALAAALVAHRPAVVLFYNPAAADDQAVKAELGSIKIPARVFVLAAPIGQLAAYSALSEQVPVSQSPTLIFIDRSGQATEIVGFADTLQIQRQLAATVAAG